MKTTYYIVKHINVGGGPEWRAHGHGLLSTLNIFNFANEILATHTGLGADTCEAKLRREVKLRRYPDPVKPEVVRVLRI